MSRPAINNIFDKIRARIAIECERISPFEHGEIEIDESYFGAKRVRGVRGRGAMGKIPVFGMLKRSGRVYTQVIRNCSLAEILPNIEEPAGKKATLFTHGFKTYDGLADFGYKKHYRIRHGHNEFAKGHNYINGIENFWGLCKVRLVRFRGIHKHKFYLHLKECEFRYNMRNENMYIYLIVSIRNHPLELF